MLTRSDHWRLDYFRHPYLIQAPDDLIRARYIDIFENLCSLNEDGKITPELAMQNDQFMMARFAAIMEEAQARFSGMPIDLLTAGNRYLAKYFEGGAPPGVRLFREVRHKARANVLVKYAEKQLFVEDMLNKGRFRISPASFYSSGSLLHAQQDLETKRTWTLPAYPYRAAGKSSEIYFGRVVPTLFADVDISKNLTDYFLFSACGRIDTRLATDFNAAAALVVHNPDEFRKRMITALNEALPGSVIFSGHVEYYDPYDLPSLGPLQMKKHFRYLYQHEYRIMAAPRTTGSLSPIFIEAGSLKDIAEAVYLADHENVELQF